MHAMPRLRAVPYLDTGSDRDTVLLTDRQREALATIGTRVRLPPRMPIYRQQGAANWVFAITEGVVKSYRDLPSGKRVISNFLFARDLFGLAENGVYVNSAQAITRVTFYRLPVRELIQLLKRDSEMQFQFLMKVTHELREAQRRAIMVNRRDAAGRLAMFVALMAAHADTTAADAHGHRRLPGPVARKREPCRGGAGAARARHLRTSSRSYRRSSRADEFDRS